MPNDLAKKLDTKLTRFNSLKYADQAFVRSVVIGEVSKAKIAMEVYELGSETEGDIKAMTTLGRLDIQEAIAELNALQGTLLKSKILYKGDAALDEITNIMENGEEEADRLKAATVIAKMGVDLIKESEKKNPNDTMKVVIENPSGNVTINFGNEKVMESFGNQEEIIDAEFEEDITEEKEESVSNENPILKKEEMEF